MWISIRSKLIFVVRATFSSENNEHNEFEEQKNQKKFLFFLLFFRHKFVLSVFFWQTEFITVQRIDDIFSIFFLWIKINFLLAFCWCCCYRIQNERSLSDLMLNRHVNKRIIDRKHFANYEDNEWARRIWETQTHQKERRKNCS